MGKKRYAPITPKPPRGANSYTVYVRQTHHAVTEANFGVPQDEIRKIVAEKWNTMSKEEQQPYIEIAAKEKEKIMSLWESKEADRELTRKKWCEKLGMPVYSSWEALDSANKKKFLKEQFSDDGEEPKKKRKKDADEESAGSDSTESDNETKKREASPRIEKKMEQREATKAAMKKIHRTLDDLGNSDSSSSSADEEDDEIERRRKLRLKQSQQKLMSNRSTSLLSGNVRISKTNAAGSAAASGAGLKKRSSRMGDREWEMALWAEERLAAVTKALDRVYEMSMNVDNFNLFGNDMIQCFYDVGTVTGEPIRNKTLKYVEHLANRWKYTVMQNGWKFQNEDNTPTPYEGLLVS